MRKDVAAKCTTGDVTRTRKLLEKQMAGKKVRQFGKVEIPKKVFISALKLDLSIDGWAPFRKQSALLRQTNN